MSSRSNAEAGPSTALFLKPKPVSAPPPPRLASTHDLLARFHLLPAYDKYVRPPPDDPPEPQEKQDNGKGKAREHSTAPQTPGGDHDRDDDDAAQTKGEKKKNSYKHLIKGVPGKHSMKKDDYLASIMQVPPKQPIQILPFDLKTQREAFSISLDGLKGWNIGTLVQESAQAREDRKKRKELKRLARAQAQLHAAQAAAASTGSPMPTAVGTPRPTTAGTPRPAAAGTPRPTAGTPRPSARPSLPPVVVPQRVGTPARTGTPTSAHPRMPGSGTPTSAHPRTGTPHPLSALPLSAGLKREREQEPNGIGTPQNGAATPTNANANGAQPRAPVPVIAAAKAGIAGARPRPLKKQRVDMQGHARDVSAVQQQPTPQGV